MEKEVFAKLNLPDTTVECRRDNTSLYTHIGRLAVFDHVFVTFQEEESVKGIYVWENNDGFKSLAQDALNNRCEAHLNLDKVNEFDVQNYMEQATQDLGDTFPEEWLDGEGTKD